MPKTIVISQYFSPSTAATSQLATDLVDYLHHKNHLIEVITSSPSKPRVLAKPYTIYRTQSNRNRTSSIYSKALSGFLFSFYSAIYLLKNSTSADKVLIFSNPPFIVFVALLNKITKGVPYIFVFQDLFPQTASVTGILPSVGPFYNLLKSAIKYSIKQSETTVVLTKNMAKRVELDFGTSSNIQTIPNWAVQDDQVIVKRSNNPLAAKWNVQDSFVVQYSGNFGRLHDITTILEAARLLRDHEIKFMFIGDGYKKHQIKAYIDNLDLRNVSLHSYQPLDQLHLSLALADVSLISQLHQGYDCVAPSKYYGILASAKPVLYLGSHNSDIAKLTRTYQNGITVTPGEVKELADSILYLYNHRDVCDAMSKKSRSLYENLFQRELSFQAYSDLLGKPQSPIFEY